jgi:molybdopterin molybdotransferase
MISFQEALDVVINSVHPLASGEVAFTDAQGKIIAEDIVSDDDIPLFDNSAMDGFAVIAADIKDAGPENPVHLAIIDEIFAGSPPQEKVHPGECIRIMTGAQFPEGADSVIIKEDTRESSMIVSIFRSLNKGENVRKRGEDCRRGEIIIKSGTLANPAVIGMLATIGRTKVNIISPPKVAILSSGNELVSPGSDIQGSCLRDSNSYTLAALVREWGGEPLLLGIARDEKADIEEKIDRGIAQADMLVTAAGISVGEGDLMRDVLLGMGAEMAFWKVAIRPGKPTAFGTLRGKPIFCLPGNPVSAMVTFLQFVRPALLIMRGLKKIGTKHCHAIVDHEVAKKKDLRSFLRVTLRNEGGICYASLTGPQGSGNLLSMARAQGLMILPESVEKVTKGESVIVEILTPNLSEGGAYPWDQ